MFAGINCGMGEGPDRAPIMSAAIAALRFFFNMTLEGPDLVRHLTCAAASRRLRPLLDNFRVPDGEDSYGVSCGKVLRIRSRAWPPL